MWARNTFSVICRFLGVALKTSPLTLYGPSFTQPIICLKCLSRAFHKRLFRGNAGWLAYTCWWNSEYNTSIHQVYEL